MADDRHLAHSLCQSHAEHGAAPLGSGSEDVLVSDGQAWRAAFDQFPCPQHGGEVVPFGHTQVLINDKMAVHIEDFLLGGGAPDMIMEGERRGDGVMIGHEPVGMESPEGMAKWCREWCAFEKEWPNLTPNERKLKYGEMVQRMFALYGAPLTAVEFFHPQKKPDGTLKKTEGWVNVNMGTMGIRDDFFTQGGDTRNLRRVTFHETRHGEQLFNGMRYNLDQARQGNPVPGDQAGKKHKAWVDAAGKAGGFPPGSKEEAWAKTHGHGFSRREGINQLGWAMKEYDERYAKIPCGEDAARTERQVICNC